MAHSRLVAEICENLNLNPSSCFEFICWPHLPIHSSISFHLGWGPSCFWPWFMVDFLRTRYNYVFYQVNRQWGEIQLKHTKPLSTWSCFEPTLQSSTMMYTIHGFTAGVFTPPSGEQGRLRRTNNQEEHTLAGSQISLVVFRILCSLSKVPLKSSNP